MFNSWTKIPFTGLVEGFYTNKWPTDLINRFNHYQQTVNINYIQYNLDILQQQATPEEAEELLETGYWPWPEDLKQLYIEKVWSNPIIKFDPQDALNYAMKVYNQKAARELLAWNSKEGQFLLYGVDIGVTDGMPKNVHNTIKCSTDRHGNSYMKKKVFTGKSLWNGYFDTETTVLKPEDIPSEVKGFSFINGPCNPCTALDYPPNYSCPFKINVKGDHQISDPWKKLWELS